MNSLMEKFFVHRVFFLIFLSSFLSRSNRIGFLVDDNGISKSAYGLPEHFLKVQNG